MSQNNIALSSGTWLRLNIDTRTPKNFNMTEKLDMQLYRKSERSVMS